MVKGHASTVEKRGKEMERDKEIKSRQRQNARKTKKAKWGRNPIVSKAVALLHTGSLYNKAHCPLLPTHFFPLFCTDCNTTLCWSNQSGELPGTHMRALSSPAQHRNCHELPELPCTQLLLEQLHSLIISFQILLDNNSERRIGREAETEGAKKGQPNFGLYAVRPSSPSC